MSSKIGYDFYNREKLPQDQRNVAEKIAYNLDQAGYDWDVQLKILRKADGLVRANQLEKTRKARKN